jgi:hypothetical protein
MKPVRVKNAVVAAAVAATAVAVAAAAEEVEAAAVAAATAAAMEVAAVGDIDRRSVFWARSAESKGLASGGRAGLRLDATFFIDSSRGRLTDVLDSFFGGERG